MSNQKKNDTTKKGLKPENIGRRKAVKTILGSVTGLIALQALPAKWGTPIIEKIILPAHAAPSGVSLNDPCDVTSNSNAFSDPLVVNVSGFVTPPSSGLTTTITASVPDGHGGLPLPTPVVATTTTQLDGTFTAAINIPNPNGIDQVDVVSSVAGASETAQCSVSFSSIEVSLDGPCNVTTTSTISSDPFIITVSGLVTPLSAGHTVTITASVPEGWGGLPLPTPVEVTTTTAVDGTYVAVIDIPNPNGLGKLDVVTSVAGSSETEQCTTPCLISCD